MHHNVYTSDIKSFHLSFECMLSLDGCWLCKYTILCAPQSFYRADSNLCLLERAMKSVRNSFIAIPLVIMSYAVMPTGISLLLFQDLQLYLCFK